MADSNGDNGRDTRGRFAKGNAGGPGNPAVRRLAEYRAAITAAVTPKDIGRIIKKLVKRALSGETMATRELLDRLIGRPQQASSYTAGGGLDFATLKTADDVSRASEQLAQAVSNGTISPDDAARVGLVLELSRKAIEMGQIAKEMRELRESITNGT